jgi:hypothetical protein
MFFAIIIIRILFVACMVFIIGYVFGNFSKSKSLTMLSRIAAVLAIVLFISSNILLFRFGGGCWHEQKARVETQAVF